MWLLKYAKYKRYIKENINKNKKTYCTNRN